MSVNGCTEMCILENVELNKTSVYMDDSVVCCFLYAVLSHAQPMQLGVGRRDP
jgi:hypothetical protein